MGSIRNISFYFNCLAIEENPGKKEMKPKKNVLIHLVSIKENFTEVFFGQTNFTPVSNMKFQRLVKRNAQMCKLF